MFGIIFLGIIIALLAGACHYIYKEHYNAFYGGKLQFLFYPLIVLIIMFGIIEAGQMFKCIIEFMSAV